MEATKQINGSYPTATFPDDITAPANIGLALTQSSSADEFCVNGTARDYADAQWHVDQTLRVTTGLCAGAVISGSIIGDYYAGATPPVGYVIPPRAKSAQSSGEFALKVSIPEAWDQITISWTAPSSMASSSTYEIQLHSPGVRGFRHPRAHIMNIESGSIYEVRLTAIVTGLPFRWIDN